MALPQGISFRQTSTYVTDVSPSTYEIGGPGGTNYPRTTPEGNNVGWEALALGSIQTRNRSSSNDARLAGIHFGENNGDYDYRIDLPSAGDYLIRAAFGDPSYAATVAADFRDTTTSLATVSGTTSTSNRFLDASGVERTAAAWPGSNASITETFATTIFRTRITRSGTNVVITHIYVESAGVAVVPKFFTLLGVGT